MKNPTLSDNFKFINLNVINGDFYLKKESIFLIKKYVN